MIFDVDSKIKEKVKGFFCIPKIDSDHIDKHIDNIETSLMSGDCEKCTYNKDISTVKKKA